MSVRLRLTFAGWSRAVETGALDAVRKWLDEVTAKLEPEIEKRTENLLIYGTSHPEIYVDPQNR